ncbi:hypothetical protein [Gilliamella sp. wkB178]|uniref:hypothetical protein n=1 Tax=Gilliamella sp. wkB178 TaxID=3120259 RepID=UPI00159EEE13|nr:hypothetical protein [Gilliamella apicola]
MAVTADLAVMVLMIVVAVMVLLKIIADFGNQVADYADGTGLNRGLNYHFGEMS